MLMKNFIELHHVHYSYPLPAGERVRAIQDVSFAIRPGERVALIGANGSGKTTLVKLINSLLLPDSGTVRVDGFSTSDRDRQMEIFNRIGLIFQNPRDQIVASLVKEDTAFGPENLCLPRQEIRKRVNASLAMCGALHLKERQTYLLSAGETQRVALAGVLALRPACLIFDETTAMLDPLSRSELLDLISALHTDGFTIVQITHDLDETLAADRILVLSAGRLVMDGTPQEVFKDKDTLRKYGLAVPFTIRFARDLATCFPEMADFYKSESELIKDLNTVPHQEKKAEFLQGDSQDVPRNTYIKVQHLSHTYMADTPLARRTLQGVSFSIPERDSVGLVGKTGSGKSTLLQHLNGLIRPQRGKVRVGEFDLTRTEIDIKTLRRQVGLVFQTPEAQFFERYVGDEVAFAARMLGYSGKLRDVVRDALQAVGLDFTQYVDRPLASLSGGQKRRVAWASFLVVQPDVLLLDEPFAGLDPLTHQEMIGLVTRMSEEGKTILLSTHHMRDLLQITQKAFVLQDGKMPFEGHVTDLFRQPDLQNWGLGIPLELRVAEGLRLKGWTIPAGSVCWEEILAWVRSGMQGGGNACI